MRGRAATTAGRSGIPRRLWASTFGFLSVLLAATPAIAQTRASAAMERAINRYRWTAEAQVDEALGRWRLGATYTTATDAYLLLGGGVSLRDEHRLRWRTSRTVEPGPDVFALGHLDVFGQSRVLTQTAFLGAGASVRGVRIEPMLGVAVDHRPGVLSGGVARAPLRKDIGPAAGARWQAAPSISERMTLAILGDASYHDLGPRRAHVARTTVQTERTGSGSDGMSISGVLHAASVRRDVYQSASFLNRIPANASPESVEATTSDTLAASISASAPLARRGTGRLRVSARLDGDVLRRRVRIQRLPEAGIGYDTDFERRRLDAEAALTWNARRLSLDLVARLGADVERRVLANRDVLPATLATQRADLLRQADFDRGAIATRARVRLDLTRSLRLTSDVGVSMTRTDTPEGNPDDRDEAAHDAALGLTWRVRPTLDVGARLSGTYVHTVYLSAVRSAENAIQRSLRLAPLVTWTPSPETRIRMTTELRATYTEDDFVLPGRIARDQSAREVRYGVEAERTLDGFVLRARGSSSTLLLGRLLADRFAEIPQDTLRTLTGWLRLQTRGRVRAEIGVRAFVRTDYSPTLTVRYVRPGASPGAALGIVARPGRSTIRQIGPTTAITWPLRTVAATIHLEGWYVWQRVNERLYGALPASESDAIRDAARRGRRTVLPNLRLSVTYHPR